MIYNADYLQSLLLRGVVEILVFSLKEAKLQGVNGVWKCLENVQIMPPCIISSQEKEICCSSKIDHGTADQRSVRSHIPTTQ